MPSKSVLLKPGQIICTGIWPRTPILKCFVPGAFGSFFFFFLIKIIHFQNVKNRCTSLHSRVATGVVDEHPRSPVLTVLTDSRAGGKAWQENTHHILIILFSVVPSFSEVCSAPVSFYRYVSKSVMVNVGITRCGGGSLWPEFHCWAHWTHLWYIDI